MMKFGDEMFLHYSLDQMDKARDISHPVDYLGSLIFARDHRHPDYSASVFAYARLNAAIACARAAVLQLKSYDLVGKHRYATILEKADGLDIDVRRIEHAEEYKSLLDRDMILIDVETSGPHPRLGDKLLSLSAMPVQIRRGIIAYPDEGGPPFIPRGATRFNFRPIQSWEFDYNGRTSREEALGLQDFVNNDVAPFHDHASEIRSLLTFGSPVIVANTPLLNQAFLNAEFELCGLSPIDCKVVDTRALSQRLWHHHAAGVEELAQQIGIEIEDRDDVHSASEDVILLARCIPQLVELVNAQAEWDERKYQRENRRLDRQLAIQRAQKKVNEKVH